MRPPYIYTMPESFLQDQSVPARWRLLAVINGFLLNGKEFYGSNDWLKTQLNCSQQTVSSAIRELEELGEITCARTATTRVIRRVIKNGEPTNQLVGGYKPTSVLDPSQLVPNSDSNSESKKAIAEPIASPWEITRVNTTTEGEELPPKKKYQKRGSPVWELRAKLYTILQAHLDDTPVVEDMGDYMRVEKALSMGMSQEDIIDAFENALADDDSIKTVRGAFTNGKLQKYLQEYL